MTGINLGQFALALVSYMKENPTAAITWFVVAATMGKLGYSAVARTISRHQIRVRNVATEIEAIIQEVTAELSTVPVNDPVRRLAETHTVLLRSNPEQPLEFWNKVGVVTARFIPGGRSRRANKRFEETVSALLQDWRSKPTDERAALAREVVEALVGSIADYINEGASPSQILAAATRRWEATSNRRRAASKNVAAVLAIVRDNADKMAQMLKVARSERYRVIAEFAARPERLSRLLQLVSDDGDRFHKLMELLG